MRPALLILAIVAILLLLGLVVMLILPALVVLTNVNDQTTLPPARSQVENDSLALLQQFADQKVGLNG